MVTTSKQDIMQPSCPFHGPEDCVEVRNGVIFCRICHLIEKYKKHHDEIMQQEGPWISRMTRYGVPRRFATSTFYMFQPPNDRAREVLSFAENYADEFHAGKPSAVFIGGVGTGKTHLASAIALHIVKDRADRKRLLDQTVRMTTAQKIVRRIKDTWNRDRHSGGETEKEAMADLIDPSLLIIDEVGVQFGSEFERNLLFEILNSRYENMRPFILISNLSLEDLEVFVGARVIDRIREGGGRVKVFDWESHRGKE